MLDKERAINNHQNISNYPGINDYQEILLKQQLELWSTQGYGAAKWGLPQGGALLKFTTDADWSGIVDLREWFSAVMPELAGLASQAYPLPELVELFTNSKQPIATEGIPSELAYTKIINTERVSAEGVPALQMMFSTVRGSVWLCSMDKLVAKKPVGARLKADRIPVLLRLSLGSSRIKLTLLRKIRVGDVLLINQQRSELKVGDQSIGRFDRQQGGYMFEEDDQEIMEEMDFDAEEIADDEMRLAGQIPVKLSFILQQQLVTVAELEDIYQGMPIPFEPGAENKIVVVANGVTVAQGRLVSIEEQLAVEITRLYQEAEDE